MKYPPGPHDNRLVETVNARLQFMEENNDDTFMLIVGGTGSGKSNLLLHIYTIHSGEEASTDYIPLTREAYAKAHRLAVKKSRDGGKPFLGYDEAFVASREAMTKWNRDILRLKFSDRVFKIFEAWCNPSMNIIDKAFIEERLTGAFFIFTKDKNRPRKYVFFTKKGLLSLYNKVGDLKHQTLKTYGKRYGSYIGWFRKYEGPLLEAYMDHKLDSAEEIDKEFYQNYGDSKTMNLSQVSKHLQVSRETVRQTILEGLREGVFEDQEIKNAVGTYNMNEQSIEKLRMLLMNRPSRGISP